MGTVFRKQTTRPLPVGAELFTKSGQRFARWKAGKRNRTAKLTIGRDGSDRIVTESATYFAKFRDGLGIEQTLTTGCRDETAARAVLGELERRAELVKAGVMTTTEDAVADHQTVPLAEHIMTFVESLKAKECTADHWKKTERYLKRLSDQCEFRRLGDLNKVAFEKWIIKKQDAGWSARNRNAYQTALVTFGNWCVENNRLIVNPFAGLSKANEKADRRYVRRAMNEDELGRLLAVARQRPLRDAMTIRRGKRKGQVVGKVRDHVRERLEWLGRERALIYKTLILTGLRKSELRALQVNQLELHGKRPHVVLNAGDEKNREGNSIPLRHDLANDLRNWIDDRKQRDSKPTLRIADTADGVADSFAASAIFVVPDGLVKILKRDLKAADIAVKDDRGRVLDVHAMRTSFGTLLSKGGVPLRTTQAAMRHGDPSLTANVYTDPRLLDVHSALDALPRLPLDSSPIKNTQTMRATGTDDFRASNLVAPPVAPAVALNADFRGHSLTSAVPDEAGFDRPQTLGDSQLRAYIPRPKENPAWWCNGSTSDSGSLSPGSNPGRAI